MNYKEFKNRAPQNIRVLWNPKQANLGAVHPSPSPGWRP
tara:strand:- start:1 stop:117 length:117 start_codon:yes stop_codon:yes gene_type:complete